MRGALIAVLPILACHKDAARVPSGHMVTLPSGRAVETISITKVDSRLGPSALMLTYVTKAESSDDLTTITAEVSDIWPEFQKEVERAHLDTGIVSATSAPSGSFISNGWAHNVIFSRDASGTWVPGKGDQRALFAHAPSGADLRAVRPERD